jgi:hypothetical protein
MLADQFTAAAAERATAPTRPDAGGISSLPGTRTGGETEEARPGGRASWLLLFVEHEFGFWVFAERLGEKAPYRN